MLKRSATLSFCLLGLGLTAFAQYKMEPVNAPPSDAPAEYATLLQKSGYRVAGASGPFCEVWFRTALPSGPKSSEDAVAFPTIPQGAFLGVVRFPGKGADRRGQGIKPGLYTMRYALYPINGDHQGVAPQRDFAVLTPIAEDKDPNATPAFEPLMAQSRKASGTPHPAVLSLEPPPAGATAPALTQEGDKDWSLTVKIGDTPVAMILVGKSDA
jgi:hypothetical protein